MTEHKINCFLNVIFYGSFSRAAEALYISQPALTYQIKALEEELGAALLIRQSGVHGICLTQDGQNFVPLAERWKELFSETRSFQNKPNSLEYRIAAVQSLNTSVMPAIYKKFLCENPDCRLLADIRYSPEAYRLMENHQLHSALITIPYSSSKTTHRPLFREKMCVLRSVRNGIQNSIHPSVLKPEHEIFLKWSNEFDSWHNYWFSGIPPVMTVNDLTFPEMLLENSNYWIVVPATIANRFSNSPGIQRCCLMEGPPDRIVYHLEPLCEQSDDIRKITQRFLSTAYDVLRTQEGVEMILQPSVS